MNLKELTEMLKDTTATLESFLESAEYKSGEKFAQEYVEQNELEYISTEIKKAFKTSFLFAISQYEARTISKFYKVVK